MSFTSHANRLMDYANSIIRTVRSSREHVSRAGSHPCCGGGMPAGSHPHLHHQPGGDCVAGRLCISFAWHTSGDESGRACRYGVCMSSLPVSLLHVVCLHSWTTSTLLLYPTEILSQILGLIPLFECRRQHSAPQLVCIYACMRNCVYVMHKLYGRRLERERCALLCMHAWE